MNEPQARILDELAFVYGPTVAAELWPKLQAALQQFQLAHPQLSNATSPPNQRVTERDVVLITYGDQIQEPGKLPLQTLDETLTRIIGSLINTVHLLPFYPYSSDDGFSVIDYRAVNPSWGSWQDVQRMGTHFRLMFDAVINHISQHSAWFQAFQRGEAPYKGYFIVVAPDMDLTKVVRPRTLPLLTPVATVDGVKHLWTTFSADQIDLNFGNPQVLLEILDVLLFYVAQGARLIRLDAIGFMWKESGTTCLHLPQTHRLIQLMRAALDVVAPDVILITETNVPHLENISYWGDGCNEAQLVYNFTLPPLTLHAFQTGDATRLAAWAATLQTPSDQTTFFNFMASHDGIGLRPVEGILTPPEIEAMADRALAHGGLVSYKLNQDGSQSPYELNIVYFDALNDPEAGEPAARQIDRFLASQAILLSLPGVPGIYVHSLFGSRNWREGVAQTGQNRTINRRKFDRAALEADLTNADSIPGQVFRRYRRLIEVRTAEPSFHPQGALRVLTLHPGIFGFVREAPDHSSRVLCLHNVTANPLELHVALAPYAFSPHTPTVNLVTMQPIALDADASLTIHLPGYGVAWLRQAAEKLGIDI